MRPRITRKHRKSFVLAAITLLISLLAALFFRNILIFFLLIGFNALLNLYQASTGLPFDMTPTIPLVVIFSMKFGFWFGLIFLFLSSIIPTIIVSALTTPNVFFSLFVGLLIGYLSTAGLTDNAFVYGLILIVFEGLIGLVIASLASVETMPPFFVFLASGVNLFYFVIFYNFLSYILL